MTKKLISFRIPERNKLMIDELMAERNECAADTLRYVVEKGIEKSELETKIEALTEKVSGLEYQSKTIHKRIAVIQILMTHLSKFLVRGDDYSNLMSDVTKEFEKQFGE